MNEESKSILDAQRDLRIESLGVKMDTLGMEFKAHGQQLDAQGKQLAEVDHLLRGVDGKNGIRDQIGKINGHLVDIDKRFRFLELRVVAITAALGAAGIYAGKVFF